MRFLDVNLTAFSDDFLEWEILSSELVFNGPSFSLGSGSRFKMLDDGRIYRWSNSDKKIGFSDDGLDWDVEESNIQIAYEVGYSNGIFVAGYVENAMYVSNDGINFNTVPVSGTIYDTLPPWSGYPFEIYVGPMGWGDFIASDGDTFVAHGNQGSLVTSTDGGQSWSVTSNIFRPFGAPFFLTNFGGLFYAYNGGGYIRISEDGVNWNDIYRDDDPLTADPFPFTTIDTFIPISSDAMTLGQYMLRGSLVNFGEFSLPLGFALDGNDLYSTSDGLNFSLETVLPDKFDGAVILYDNGEYYLTTGGYDYGEWGASNHPEVGIRSGGSWDFTEVNTGIAGQVLLVGAGGWHVGIRAAGRTIASL